MSRSGSGKIALFIEGANLHATARTLGFDIDYKRLLMEFQSQGRRGASTTPRSSRIRNTSSIVPDRLARLQRLPSLLRRGFIDATGAARSRAIWISKSRSAMELAAHADEIPLFSGDGDLPVGCGAAAAASASPWSRRIQPAANGGRTGQAVAHDLAAAIKNV